MTKANIMVQWTRCNWPLPWLSEISGTIHLEQPGLMAGRQIQINQLQIELFNFFPCLTNKRYFYNSTDVFKLVFSGCFLKNKKSRRHKISY